MASSLLMSRQFYGAGEWPLPTIVERQQIHAKAMSTLRGVANEKFDPHDDTATLTESQLLEVYEVRSPYSFVRFALEVVSTGCVEGAIESFCTLA